MQNGQYYVIEEYKGERIIIKILISGDDIVGRSAFVGTLDDLQPKQSSFNDLDDIFDAVLKRLIIERKIKNKKRKGKWNRPISELHVCTFACGNLIDVSVRLNYMKKHVSFFSYKSYLCEQKSFPDAAESIMSELDYLKKEINKEYDDLSLDGIKKSLKRQKEQSEYRKKYPELYSKQSRKLGFWRTIRALMLTKKYGVECGFDYLEGKKQYRKK